MNIYNCRSYRSNSIRFLRLQPGRIYRFKGNSFSLLVLRPATFIRFKGQELKILNLLALYQVRSFSGLQYKKNRLAYQYIRFKSSLASSTNTIPYISRDVNQTNDFWIIDKAGLIEVGLIPKNENSLGELILSLILSWSDGKLDSSRINVIFYRHIVFEEDSQFFESQSFLIDWLNTLVSSQFPSKL